MSRKNQSNDGRDESLTDKQNDISSTDPVPEGDQSPEKTVDTVEEIEEKYEEIADKSEDDVDADMTADQHTDQGFEQKPVVPLSANGSGGKGMAGTAMGLSLLALAGTGYNLYDSNVSKSVDGAGSEQAAVDYSTDIAAIQEQINSLMQSQEELTAMATSAQQETVAETGQAEQVTAADESTGQDADTATTAIDDTAQADSDESATDDQVAVDEQADESQALAVQDQEPGDDAGASDADMADNGTTDSEGASMQAETQTATVNSEQPVTDQVEPKMTTEAETAPELDSQAEPETVAATSALADAEKIQEQIQQARADALASLPSGDEIKKMAMEQVSVVLDDAKKRLSLSEVAQLLSIGEQRLALAADVGGAQAAFSMADQRLSELSDSAVEPVRESINTNLAALENLEVVDKNALTQELTDMTGSIDTLAFKPLDTLSDSSSGEQGQTDSSAQPTQDSEQSSAGGSQSGDPALSLEGAGAWLKSIGSKVGNTIGDVGSGIAGDLKGMVTIQKTGSLSDVMLAPEQQYFIRENIKLQLGSAQRAVIQGNTGVYKQSLVQAQSIINDYFDTENEDVKSVSTRLQDLEQINLDVEMPDVSAASASLAEVLKQLPPMGSTETNSN